MGVGRRKLAPLWALALALACAQHTGHAQGGSSESSYGSYLDLPAIPQGPSGDSLRGVTVVPPLRAIPVVRAPDPVHNGRVCSTWGDFHYKTFDGAVFRFPGLCNYVFSAHCGGAYEDFNVQLRRSRQDGAVAPSRVIMKLEGLVVELTSHSVLVSGRPVQLPFSQAGVLIERSSSSLKVVAKLGLVFMWNQDDSLLLELDSKFANQTCGLCGDFNGIPASSEFLSHNTRLTPVEFGNLQKLDGPMEQCQDPAPENKRNCSTAPGVCEEVLGGELFSSCAELVDVNSYVEACRQDLCLCDSAHHASCICQTLAEYARQCAHAGGLPLDWRGPDLCPLTCPHDMEYHECRSPCADTCSNPERSQLCEDHCVAGCFCPEGTVLDDIGQAGCVPVTQCACTYNGATYASGAKYSTDCTECTCSGGRWSCQDIPCPGTCSVLGGAHFSTFDERQYTVHGDCSYVLAKSCNSSTFTVLAELRRCGLTDSETCLKSVTLNLDGGQTVVVVKASGEVFVNHIYTQLPVSAANVTIFRPSTFFIIAHSNLGLQLDIQLVPTMQVAVRLEPEFRGRTCGLCGNFNRVQADDFRAISGVVEGTAAAFFNTFKTHASCPNVKNNFEDPCSLSVENEKFAQHWCSRLTDAQGPFAQCHSAVSPGTYHSNCLFDTCNCEKSEDCLCAALASYVRACAAKGVLLRGWRDGVCTKHTSSCPKSMTYHYHISTCQPTCRARSEPDLTCGVSFVPVDGCACPEGTFLDDVGKCVEATSCPCYHGGSVVPNGESVHDSGTVCTCTQGTLTCIGGPAPAPVCDAPMVFFDCRNATAGATGAGCQKSCHTLDMECYSSQCVPGCVCPDGLVADGLGGCIAEEECPCVHNEASYGPGETIWTGCNTCTCENRKWRCSDEPCLATCAVYGDGHYLTFDGRRYSFSGDCEYTLLQDQCGGNVSAQDAFRVVTENVPCGTTGTTCSKAIKIFLGSYELKLSDGKVEVVEKGKGQEPPYSIRQMGIFLVLDTDAGLVLLWDRRTSLFLRLSPEFKGRVCGLCGNFDDNAMNDFTTRSQSVVGDALEFGNSWKFSPSCPDAPAPRDSCAANPYRKSWAQKQCSIVHSATFAACHAHVEPAEYYEACVQDACACDSGGDCECFCTAVAAYAQACHEVGVCVSWRSPDVCPLFCDFYNPEGQCEWHYQPCGAPCMRTCRNPSGECLHNVPGLEGCYPKCPSTAPIFDEDEMKCVATCPLPPPAPRCHVHGKSYRPGATVPSDENCHSCVCTESGVRCAYDAEACICTYHGRHYKPGTVIYHTTDGTGGCISARCGANGTIDRTVSPCSPTTAVPPTTFSFSTTPSVVSSTRAPSSSPSPAQSTAPAGRPSTTVSAATSRSPRTVPSTAPTPAPTDCGEQCLWSPWLDVSRPGRGSDSGDYDTLDNLRAHGYRVCQQPREVECRAEDAPAVALSLLGQRVQCTPAVGLTCHNREQASGQCHNYQIRILCCSPLACHTSSLTVHPTTSSTTHTGLSPTPVTATGRVTASEATTTPAPGTPSLSQTTAVTPSPTTGPTTAGTTPSRSSPTLETSATPSEPAPHEPSRVSCMQEICNWTQWIDGSYPGPGRDSGDFDTFQNLRAKGYKFCKTPSNVQCRAQFFPNTPLAELGQDVTCNREEGLICLNKNQLPPICYNYEIRIQCCQVVDSCRGGTTVPPTSETTQPTRPETSSSAQTAMTRAVPSPTTRHTAPTANTQAIGSRTTTRHHTGTTPGTTTTTLATTTHPTSTSRTSTSSTETRSPISGTPKGTTSTSTTSSTSTSRTRTTSKGTGSSTSLTHTGTTPAPTTTTSATTTHPTSTPRTSTSSTETGRSTSTTHPRTRTSSSPTTSSTPVPITGTTSVPTTSTSHPGTQEMTHSQPTTPDCQPRCSWTKWFDVDFPAPGVHGGDKETYDNILRSGERICRRPEEITRLQCRAENHPDVTIEQLGQVVQCDPDVGLVCQNRDQDGAGRMCLNYEVRVLCCETPSSCPTTPPLVTSSPMTPSTAPSTLAPSTALVHGSSQTTTPCFCFVAEKLYPAGAVIYHQRDLEGHCYHATCNPDCQVVRRVDSDCPPTTPPAIQTTPPSTSTSQPVTPSGCSNTIPPRKKGETWPMPNCSQATCEGHDTISVHPRQCPEVSEPTCANGYPPQKEVDQDGCCYHYQCQCVCSGWGDPHYITFDGTYYTFLDNCTYVLMQQIVPVFGHLRVLIDNYFCDAEDGLSCPQSIIVEYGHDRVVMTRRPVAGVMTNQVIFNGKVVGPGFEKDGIVISRLGIKMYVTIPKLGVQVMFTGLIFSVEVPFNKFANNTEGQCGTCTNDKKDECRLPGGKVAASCSAMSHHWKVTNPDQPSCSGSPGSPTDPTTMSPTEPATTCPQSAICELILSEVFEPCHSTIPPLPFYEGCAFDHCHVSSPDVVCSGLELYASLCAAFDVCIDWRGLTNGTCSFTCPPDKVYLPCGPSNPPYCYGNDSANLLTLPEAGPITEGCFCPESTLLFSTSVEVCVPTGCPRCMGPSGEPVMPGDTISFACQECTCEGSSMTMACRAKTCPPAPACELSGFVSVPLAPAAGECCPQYTCACNASYCPKPVDCPAGAHMTLLQEGGACCPIQKCRWTQCNVNGTLYEPGAVVSSTLCETCRCELPDSPEVFKVTCETQICPTHCPVGYAYQAQDGQCCGQCVQVACVSNSSSGSTHLYSPGESWPDPEERCVTHECERHLDGLVVVTTRKACPPLSCPRDQAQLSEDGCCLFCPPPPSQNMSTCAVHHRLQVIREQGCSSTEPVRLAYCRGNCGDTGSMYSLAANTVEHRCSCCQELRTSQRKLSLRCADGSRRDFNYTQVEECGCQGQRCPAPADAGHPGPSESPQWSPRPVH